MKPNGFPVVYAASPDLHQLAIARTEQRLAGLRAGRGGKSEIAAERRTLEILTGEVMYVPPVDDLGEEL